MTVVDRSLDQLRNRRDLKAEILSLAADLLADAQATGHLIVHAPVISETTVREEWNRLLPAIAPRVRARMSLEIVAKASSAKNAPRGFAPQLISVDRPNYRFEVLRQMVGASLEDDGPVSIKGLVDAIGASQTPIRRAILDLQKAGIVHAWGRGLMMDAEELSAELLAKLGAQPQKIAFRFERGAQIRSPDVLIKRVLPLLGSAGSAGIWWTMALSGTPVAQADVPALDLVGAPRLDLTAQVPRNAKTFEVEALRQLDDGLEPQPSILAPAPLVVTLVRAQAVAIRDAGLDQTRCAHPADVFLSLIDMGLRDQAVQYAKAMRS